MHVSDLRLRRIVAAEVDIYSLQLPHTVLVLQLLLRLGQDNASIARRIRHHRLHVVVKARLRQLVLYLAQASLRVNCLQQFRLVRSSAHL